MKRKQELELQYKVEQKSACKFGDGVAWLRGAMIGKGSYGSVYFADSKKPRLRYSYLPSVIAVKSAEVSISGSIQKEREVLSNIQWCPYIIRCFGDEITTSENGEMVYNLLLEYGPGGTLAGLIKKSSGCGLPESDVRCYTRSILRGLNHIHESRYVHCDMKPENIILLPITTGAVTKFKAKIGDFGLAKRVEKNDPYLRGTPLYLSPEAVVDNIREPPSDVWALGCIVLEMLTGKPPWDTKEDQDAESLLRQIGKGCTLPTIPSKISKEGRDFLKCCFVRTAKFRLTAEMLLNHPYIEGLVDDDGEVEQEDEVFNADLSFTFSDNDDEFSSYGFSDDCSFISEGDSFYSSSEEDVEEMDNEVVSSFAEEEASEVQERVDITKSSNAPELDQVSSIKMQQCPIAFAIPAGL
ncbi:mitogen-activated protein kinase kinase kinase 20-like [Cornus florida]|uniref:mitogen-activated protein kinase kinase kinase 20-like n=1 Tax=Cornus florida TaxID=4283 RepID=UPI002898EE0E|nr:mitogen-activated protein kinase kinase kinase 20-like [Cornus florida]